MNIWLVLGDYAVQKCWWARWWRSTRARATLTVPCVPSEQLMQLYSARQRRRLNRGLRRKQHSLLKRLRKAKKEAPPMEKPEVVKTHLRDMIILPEMVGSMVGVYNGKTFNQVEIKVRGAPLPGRAGACPPPVPSQQHVLHLRSPR